MRSCLALALVTLMVGCSASTEDVEGDESALNEVVTTLELPMDLRPGEVRSLNFRSGAAFRVRLSQADVPADRRAAAELQIIGPNLSRQEVNLEPVIEHRPESNETLGYTLVLRKAPDASDS
mgnify:CR=1 FL=1